MKKILFTLHLPPPIHGASILNEHIKNAKTINSNFHTTYFNLATSREINDMGRGVIRKFLKIVFLLIKIHYKCIITKYHLFYTTISPYGMPFIRDSIIILSLKLHRKPIIIHLHGKGIKQEVASRRLKFWYYKLVFKNVKVIHNSPVLYHDIENIVSRENCYFVANGTTPIFSDNNNNIKIKNDDTKIILYLSNLEETKGPMILLEAVNILKNEHTNFKVVFAGQWSADLDFQNKFEKYILKNHLSEYASYVGPKYGSDKKKLFEEASIFTLPTFYRNECFPVSILEAMSAGLPVVATDEGAIREIIDDRITGLIAEKKNSTDLAEKLSILLKDNDLLNKMSKRGFEKFYSKYTVEAYNQRIESVINKVI